MSALSRRGLLRTGGMLSLGAMIAACGDRQDSEAPGRVGNAPPVTDFPPGEVDDVALLRTATSLEYTAIEVYRSMSKAGVVDDAYATPFERFVSDHGEHAGRLSTLTRVTGGEPYKCPNPWIMERAVGPILANIIGDETAGIEASDNPQRDVANLAMAFENLAGASYQAMVAQLTEPELRHEMMMIAVDEVRHASVIAMIRTGTPKAYVGPQLFRAEAEVEEDGLAPLFVLQSRSGSLAPLTLVLGKPDEAGGRFSATLETPAENSVIYDYMSC